MIDDARQTSANQILWIVSTLSAHVTKEWKASGEGQLGEFLRQYVEELMFQGTTMGKAA